MTFEGLKLFELGEGFFFEVSVVGLEPVRTTSTFSVVIGPAALLRFRSLPSDNNVQNVYFASQPSIEVLDLGGNRVVDGLHVITLSMVNPDDRLRGPKVRWTYRGLAAFEKLRIRAPGYDKQVRASSPGLQSATTPFFGVIPNGIPHNLQVVSQPQSYTLTGQPLSNKSIVFALYDMYGVPVTEPPATTLAPYVAEGSPKRLEDICNDLCRANSYPIVLTAQGVTTGANPILLGNANTQLTLSGNEATSEGGLVMFDAVTISLVEGERAHDPASVQLDTASPQSPRLAVGIIPVSARLQASYRQR